MEDDDFLHIENEKAERLSDDLETVQDEEEDETKLPEELDFVDENVFPSSSLDAPDDPKY
jgi:hypothetical protein